MGDVEGRRGEGEELTIMGMLLDGKWLTHQIPFDVCFPLFGMVMGRKKRRGEGEELTIMGMLLACKWLIHQPLSFLLMSASLSLEWGWRRKKRRGEEEKEKEKERNSP
jgi:hypothetical protein